MGDELLLNFGAKFQRYEITKLLWQPFIRVSVIWCFVQILTIYNL